jgi:hypothetical protein
MCVKIIQINSREIQVNGKTILKDMDNDWYVSNDELTCNEAKALYEHLKAIERCTHPSSAKSLKVTSSVCTCETTVVYCKRCGKPLSKPVTDC